MLKFITPFVYLLLLCNQLPAENYLLNGGQNSTIKYQLIQQITPTPETVTIHLSFVEPQNFSSATYTQKINDFSLVSQLRASKYREE